jgi:hypothetical protein
MSGWATIGLVSFALGGMIAVFNVYASFLRYPIHRFFGKPPEAYRHESGVPIVGTLFLILAAFLCESWTIRGWVIVLLVIDTGGLFWAAVLIPIAFLADRRKPPDKRSP